MELTLTFNLPIFFSLKLCLLFTSAAYIQVYFRLDFIMDANTMNPDHTARSLIWVHIICKIGYIRI